MRRMGFIAASLLVSAFFLWLALRGQPLGDIWERIRQANILWIVVSLAMVFGALWTRAVRWRGLLGFKVPLRQAFFIVNVTFLVNQLPLRAGEVARSILAGSAGVPVVTAATSIVVERLLDTLLVVIMLAFALSRAPNASPTASQAAALFGIASVVAFAVLVAFARFPQVAHKLFDFAERLVPLLKRIGVRKLLDNMLDGLHPLTNFRSAAFAIGWTIIAWAFSLASFYALELALGVQGVDMFNLALLGVSLASFSIAIPVSVASVGPFEAAVLAAGEAANLSSVTALSLGFLFHGAAIFSYAVWGTISLTALGVSLGELLQAKEEKKDLATEDTESTESN